MDDRPWYERWGDAIVNSSAAIVEGFGHVASLGMVDNVWKAEGYYNEIGRNSPGYAIGGVGALVVGAIATGGAGAEIEGADAGVDALDGGKALDGMPNEASEPMGGENDGQPTNEGSKPCRGTNCFVADTPVQVADGDPPGDATEPIQDVQPGSSVETASPSDGLTRGGYTTAYFVHPAFEVDSISFGDSVSGPVLETITCTTGHKFFTPNGQLPACELKPGSVVCTRDSHGMVVLRNVEKHGAFTVYNFTVDKDHTYYVGKLHGGIWVHNQGPCGGSGLAPEDSWGNPNSLSRHFADHGGDFGSAPEDEYAQQASDFFAKNGKAGIETKIDSGGTIRMYEQGSNTFGSYNADGTTKTFFKPSEGSAYWGRQPGVPF